MERKFWAQQTKRKVGPCATREEALELYRETYPLTKGQRERFNKGDRHIGRILSGYGSEGPWFDMQWHPALPEA